MSDRFLKKSLRIAKTEYIKWLRNPRMLIGGILIIVIYTLAVVPLLERAEKMGIPMNIFEPIIAVGNSGLLVMLLPSVFLILQSDYPVIEPNSLMYLSRTGKKLLFMHMKASWHCRKKKTPVWEEAYSRMHTSFPAVSSRN